MSCILVNFSASVYRANVIKFIKIKVLRYHYVFIGGWEGANAHVLNTEEDMSPTFPRKSTPLADFTYFKFWERLFTDNIISSC